MFYHNFVFESKGVYLMFFKEILISFHVAYTLVAMEMVVTIQFYCEFQ